MLTAQSRQAIRASRIASGILPPAYGTPTMMEKAIPQRGLSLWHGAERPEVSSEFGWRLSDRDHLLRVEHRGFDLWHVADHPAIACKPVDIPGSHTGHPFRLEIPKCFADRGPLGLDHPPVQARGENDSRHRFQVTRQLARRFWLLVMVHGFLPPSVNRTLRRCLAVLLMSQSRLGVGPRDDPYQPPLQRGHQAVGLDVVVTHGLQQP